MSDSTLRNEPAALPSPDRLEGYFLWFFAGAFVLFLFFYGILPLTDPDFWWHLKSGQFMAEKGGLLQADPFSFTGDGVVTAREALILRGYWLWELSAYGLYSLLGFNGIFLLNLLTLLGMAGVAARQMFRERVNPALAALLLTLGFYLVKATYALERPQLVSFLGAALLLSLLSRVRDGGRLSWPLPLLMMVWANLHGGFVIGDLILGAFAVGAAIEFRHDLLRLRSLLFWVSLGLGASLLNPTGTLAFTELLNFHNSGLMTGISEYQSTWVKYQSGSHFVALLWLLIALYGLATCLEKRLYWPELFVAIFLAYISYAYARNIGFFTVAMLAATAASCQRGARARSWSAPLALSLLLLGLCASFLLWKSYDLYGKRQGVGPVKLIYPEAAITFLHDSGLQGRMYNSYEYGGYLLWRLAPQIKTFIDGRGLDPQVFADWQKLSAASTVPVDGRREYEVLLDRYAVDYVIQAIYDGDGRIQPLMKSLLAKPEWVPIYLDTFVYIFARLNPKNGETISTFRIDKKEFATRLLLTISYICQAEPQEAGFQVARAGMLIYLEMVDDAQAQVDAIAALDPRNSSLSSLRRDLALLRLKRATP